MQAAAAPSASNYGPGATAASSSGGGTGTDAWNIDPATTTRKPSVMPPSAGWCLVHLRTNKLMARSSAPKARVPDHEPPSALGELEEKAGIIGDRFEGQLDAACDWQRHPSIDVR